MYVFDNMYCTIVPLLKKTPERASSQKRTQALAASIVNAFDAPSHQRTPDKDRIIWQIGCSY